MVKLWSGDAGMEHESDAGALLAIREGPQSHVPDAIGILDLVGP